MKVNVKQYARSLFEMVTDKSEAEAKDLIVKFVDFLHKRQDLNKAAAIIVELENLFDEKNGEEKAELLSARPLSPEAKKQIISYLQNKVGGKGLKLEETIDQNLIGGFVLRYNGLVIDGSLQNNLRKFKKQLSN